MKHIFKSDANFKKNVTINKTLKATQIEDQEFTTEVTLSYEETHENSETISKIGSVYPKSFSYRFTINIPAGVKNDNIGNLEIKHSAVSLAYTITGDNTVGGPVEISYSCEPSGLEIITNVKVTGIIPVDTTLLKASYTITYSYDYTVDKKFSSYLDKTLLYGENGALRDIQKRLENLKSNFESIGFKYKASDEFSSSIETLMVNSATVDDVILPKEVYDGKKISLAEIIDNINDRIIPFEQREKDSTGIVYNNSNEQIGIFIKENRLLIIQLEPFISSKAGDDFAYAEIQTNYNLSQTTVAFISPNTTNIGYINVRQEGSKIILYLEKEETSALEIEYTIPIRSIGLQLQ